MDDFFRLNLLALLSKLKKYPKVYNSRDNILIHFGIKDKLAL